MTFAPRPTKSCNEADTTSEQTIAAGIFNAVSYGFNTVSDVARHSISAVLSNVGSLSRGRPLDRTSDKTIAAGIFNAVSSMMLRSCQHTALPDRRDHEPEKQLSKKY